VRFVCNLVWLNIVAQVFSAFLMPLVIALPAPLAAVNSPEPYRPRGAYLAIVVAVCAIVSAVGILGGLRAPI
jgi:hypothetical protein